MSFHTKNFTRYNTEDLEALLGRIADYITVATGLPAKLDPRIQRIEFHDYSPADPIETYRTWDSNNNNYNTHKRRKYVGPIKRARPERVPLLVPRMLWASPVEALASAMGEIECAPVEMLQRLSQDLVHMFQYDHWKHAKDGNSRPNIDISDLRLRIEKTAAKKAGNDERQREKLRLALGSVTEAYYDARSAIHHITLFIAKMEHAAKYDNSHENQRQVELAKLALRHMEYNRGEGYRVITDDLKRRRAELGAVEGE